MIDDRLDMHFCINNASHLVFSGGVCVKKVLHRSCTLQYCRRAQNLPSFKLLMLYM